jgi:hypothetical protein
MSIHSIILLAIAVIIGILLIKFVAKIFFKVLIFLAVAGIICYLIFFYTGGNRNSGEKTFMLYSLQEKYCAGKLDTVKCECIINPLLNDLNKKYKSEEIAEISKDPAKTVEVLVKLLSENRTDIKACLKEKNAEHDWNEFIGDIKSLKFGDKFRDAVKAIKTEE